MICAMPNPFELPVHRAVVHFPVAMLTATWVCLLLLHATARSRWASRAWLFEVIGVVTLPFAIGAGFVDLRGFDTVLDPRWDHPLIWHIIAASAGAVLFTVHLLITRGPRRCRTTPWSSPSDMRPSGAVWRSTWC